MGFPAAMPPFPLSENMAEWEWVKMGSSAGGLHFMRCESAVVADTFTVVSQKP